ncbi:hypothetical protein CHARACLAT_007724 [Characodon lateralis]|uniref:Uncharacterized protein n=1 Tax=Characodon lateralis TaxID=208331 RepID=A0ABU7DYU4_9TELE|nr:hypothetical protein [Characodon lateralis]
MNGVIKVQVWLRSTEANSIPDSFQQRLCLYNAEWSSFSRYEGSTEVPQYNTALRVILPRPAERAPSHSYIGYLQVNPLLCSLWMLSSTSSPWTTVLNRTPQHGSHKRYCLRRD